MIFDEFSMFDFRGFFLSRLIVCDLNMPHDCLFNTISSCLCCLQIFARQISTKIGTCIIKMVLQRISTCTSMPFRKKILFFKRKLICNGTNGS